MKGKRVLIAPLDWGLGHASRCVPIIQTLLELKCTVFIAGTGDSLNLLKNEFPEIPSFELPGYNPVYPQSGRMMQKLALQAFRFIHTVQEEHRVIKELVIVHHIHLVISDNRYGCYHEKIPCVFITHQLRLLAPRTWALLGMIANVATSYYQKKFTYCWVPDYPGSLLTGKMSETQDKSIRFIGPVSRLSVDSNPIEKLYDVMVIISGPEPQRNIFEKLITHQLINSNLKAIIVRGVVGDASQTLNNRIEIVDHLNSKRMSHAISQSKLIVCRSGYSSIMDLIVMKKKAIFIPTPGQTEQEYLAKKFEEDGVTYFENQDSFDLAHAISESENYSGFGAFDYKNTFMEELVDQLKSC